LVYLLKDQHGIGELEVGFLLVFGSDAPSVT